MTKDYTVSIELSSRELTASDRIKAKHVMDAIKLDEAVGDNESLVLNVTGFVVLNIHNENASDNKDYQRYVIETDSGDRYYTGSKNFWNTFSDIYEELKADGGSEAFSIKIFKRPSTNYKGKSFISCALV